MSQCGADTEANDLMDTLLEGDDFTIPTVDLNDPAYKVPVDPNGTMYSNIKPITPDELTQKSVDGTGFFDVIMAGAAVQLKVEYQAGRITGAEYTKAYIATIEAALQTATTILTTRDQVFWQSQRAQIDAINGMVELESIKVNYAEAQITAKTAKANYALTKLKLSSEEMNYCTAKYNLANLMPAQLGNLIAEREGAELDNDTKAYTLTNILPVQRDAAILENVGLNTDNQTKAYTLSTQLPAQTAQITAQTGLITSQKTAEDYQVSDILPAQKAQTTAQTDLITSQKTAQDYTTASLLPAQVAHEQAESALISSQKTGQDYQNTTLLPDQHSLLTEQINVQHAQTHDTNLDGTTVTGILGAQKSLYIQQVQSYMRDAEVKAAKLWMDGWSVMRTTDEGLTPPTNMSNDNINNVLSTLATKNGFF